LNELCRFAQLLLEINELKNFIALIERMELVQDSPAIQTHILELRLKYYERIGDRENYAKSAIAFYEETQRRKDESSKIINADSEEQNGIAIKTGTLSDVSVLLKGSKYADAFANGTLTHTFLDIDDYHRYHFPVTGTVKEVLTIPEDDAPGGVIVWDQKEQRYKEYYSETIGWQSIETRGIVIVETDNGALAAIVPVGMCQVSSVNFEETVKPGVSVKKGDPLGYFMFGGSDIIMIFSENAGFTMSAKPNEHLEMGNAYGRIQ
jgi:phosphatidylserine decarboxylase